MRRGMFVLALALAASLVACGSDGKPDRTIAFLRASAITKDSQDAFLAELADAGWKVGDNLKVLDPDVNEMHADPADATATAQRWVADGADLIVALSTSSATSAEQATTKVPILTIANDPVAAGLVKDAREPEGNVTGISFRVPPDRTLDVATRLVPNATKVGLLWPSDDPGATSVRDAFLAAAKDAKQAVASQGFASVDDVAAAVQKLVDAGAQSVVLVNAPTTVRAFDQIEAATDAAHLPVIANTNSCTFAVVVLAPDNAEAYGQIGRQAARLLGGTKVRDVPLEDPGAFHLVVNDAAAKKIGVAVPQDLRNQADAISG